MQIKKITLETPSPGKIKNFYGDELGLRCIFDYDSVEITLPGSIIQFTKSGNDAFYHFAVNIPENKIEEAAEWLKQKVELILFEDSEIIDFNSWDAHSIYFTDPVGNIVELIARHRLQNSSNENFSARDFLSVSEMGLPVEDVKTFYYLLNKTFDIPLFGKCTENFAACGDDDGLFIIVKNRRQWFPEQRVAEKFGSNIFIETGKSSSLTTEDGLYKIFSS